MVSAVIASIAATSSMPCAANRFAGGEPSVRRRSPPRSIAMACSPVPNTRPPGPSFRRRCPGAMPADAWSICSGWPTRMAARANSASADRRGSRRGSLAGDAEIEGPPRAHPSILAAGRAGRPSPGSPASTLRCRRAHDRSLRPRASRRRPCAAGHAHRAAPAELPPALVDPGRTRRHGGVARRQLSRRPGRARDRRARNPPHPPAPARIPPPGRQDAGYIRLRRDPRRSPRPRRSARRRRLDRDRRQSHRHRQQRRGKDARSPRHRQRPRRGGPARPLHPRHRSRARQLQAARRDLALEATFAKLDRFDLIILDDISYARKDQAETSVLFELIVRRYETRSLAIAANQPFSAWDSVFPDQAPSPSRPSTGSSTMRPSWK